MLTLQQRRHPCKFPAILCILALAIRGSVAFAVADNLNLRPRQVVSEVTSEPRFESPSRNDLFRLVDVYDDSIIIGARDAVYNLSTSTLVPKLTIQWKALGQTIEECHMKGKSEGECHNFVRVAARLRSGRTLVCGTHAFSPQCREYEFSVAEDRFVERQEFNGQAISPYDPLHNSTFYYSHDTNSIFVGTVSDFGGNDPLFYRKQLPRGESLRTQKDDLRVMQDPDFVGSFAFKEHVYFWYREKAAETMDNNREPQIYARVGRICLNDRGGPSPATDRWSSFLKARLNCSVPADVPFYFNEIQSISEVVDDGNGDALVYAVFQTARSSILMSAVCAFRMSQVVDLFDHGRFKTQKTPQSIWAPYQKFYPSSAERPGKCIADSRKLTDVSFILKNPLIYDMVPSEGHRPLLVEGPGRAELTQISVLSRVTSVRGQTHDVIFFGRADGTIGKLVDTSVNQTSVLVETVRVFDKHQPVIALKVLSPNELIVVSMDRVVKLPTHHCSLQTSCAHCVHLRDPQCAWDLERGQCVHRSDWTQGSFVQNILTGISEQCPGITGANGPFGGGQDSYIINDDQQQLMTSNAMGNLEETMLDSSSVAYSSSNLIMAVVVAVVVASAVGFMVGYRISKWRIIGEMQAASSGSSSNSSDYDSYGRARLTRHDSLTPSKVAATELYSNAPTGKNADAVSLVFSQNIHGQVVPVPLMSSISNGGSGIATPRYHHSNAAIAIGATLPRDYKVKKVYL